MEPVVVVAAVWAPVVVEETELLLLDIEQRLCKNEQYNNY